MSFPEGSKVTRRSITLPREVVDEIFHRAALPGTLHLHEKPFDTAFSRAVEVWYEGAVYTVHVALDGSKASVDGYWGSTQLVVNDAEADEDQLSDLVKRWKVGE